MFNIISNKRNCVRIHCIFFCPCKFRMYVICFKTQEKEAKIQMQKKAKELQAARRESQKAGRSAGFGGGFGSGSFTQRDNPVIDNVPMDTPKPSYTAPSRYAQQVKS